MPVGTQRVVALALLRVAENLVGFRDLLEARGGFLALGYVGMVLARQPPISGLDRLVVGRLGHAEDLVIVLVIHVVGWRREGRLQLPAQRKCSRWIGSCRQGACGGLVFGGGRG